jgi:hypothetical protein
MKTPRACFRRILSTAASVALACSIASCGARSAGTQGQEAAGKTQPASSPAEGAGADPRAAFESSGMLSGLSAGIEAVKILRASRGSPRAGVALAYGSSITNAVAAGSALVRDERGRSTVIDVMFSATGTSSVALPGPALAIAVSGESVVVSCSDPGGKGILLGYRPDDAGGGFAESWRREDRPRDRLLPAPGGRFVAGGDDGILSVHDAADGRELWRGSVDGPIADLAYAPGIVIAAARGSLSAYDEGSGKRLWGAALGADAVSVSAGAGLVAALTRSGSLETFVLADGAALCSVAGPFDPAVRAIADSGRVIAALPRGGARELELKAGSVLRSWDWDGPSSFLAADGNNIYAGASGAAGPRIIAAPRSGTGEPREIPLPAAAFDAPAAAHGSRGGLLMLLQDGSVALATGESTQSPAPSALDAAASPPEPAATAIATALGRFRSRNPAEPPSRYLRFDVFVSGVPVDAAVAFTAYRYEAKANGRSSFAAVPAAQGALIAAYDDQGGEIEASVDELGSRAGVDVRLQKGKTYWIVAGRSASSEAAPFRLFLK